MLVFMSCQSEKKQNPLKGTWKLLTGTLVENGKTTITDYTKGQSFVKIINDTHFAFLLHDLNKGADSTKIFSAGGGKYDLNGNTYTEHLEYCSDRNWENHDFTFTVTFSGDTLVQKGIEKVDNMERLNTEKYIRVK